MDLKDLDKMKFYQWQMISLKLKNMTIDLIIKDYNNFLILLKFLMYSLRSVDGVRNSAIEKLKHIDQIINKN